MYWICSFSSVKRSTARSPTVLPSFGSVMISGIGMKLLPPRATTGQSVAAASSPTISRRGRESW